MGFRTGSYAKVWEVKPVSATMTELRISISRKNRDTGEYEQDFGGYVRCVGTACASQASGLREGDRIRIGDTDVTRRYDKEAQREYTNFVIFSFERDDGTPGGQNQPRQQANVGTQAQRAAQASPGEPEVPEGDTDELPF